MIEYKTERVDPLYEEELLKINASFGWQLIDSQEVYNESTHIENASVSSYGNGFIGGFMKGFTGNDGKINLQTHTKVTNYITLRFGRDTKMPSYDKLTELEEQFYSNANVVEPKKPNAITAITVIGVILIVVSVIMAIAEGTAAELWEIAVCIVFPLAFIPLTIAAWARYRKKSQYHEDCISRAVTALSEAQEIIDEG